MKTLRLKVKPDGYAWLNHAAREVNQVWNWANATSEKAASPFYGPKRWLSAYDLDKLSSGSCKLFEKIGSDTINRVNAEYVMRRRQARKYRLRWRVSAGVRRSLGWLPFKSVSLHRHGDAFRFMGKTFRVFDREALGDLRWKQGCFAQDSVGDWWLCLPVDQDATPDVAPIESVGIDLGLKAVATTSDGEMLEAAVFYRDAESSIGAAQRRGHKRQAKRLHRKAKRQRQDALHKFSRRIVDRYQNIIVGDVSSSKLAKTRMAKSVFDSGWSSLRWMLQYKGEHAGRSVEIVNEAFTTRACSDCGALSGPQGRTGLAVRVWTCVDCGATHSRDVNAARNILALRYQRPSAGTRGAQAQSRVSTQTQPSVVGDRHLIHGGEK